jgi:hypothetical protein
MATLRSNFHLDGSIRPVKPSENVTVGLVVARFVMQPRDGCYACGKLEIPTEDFAVLGARNPLSSRLFGFVVRVTGALSVKLRIYEIG